MIFLWARGKEALYLKRKRGTAGGVAFLGLTGAWERLSSLWPPPQQDPLCLSHWVEGRWGCCLWFGGVGLWFWMWLCLDQDLSVIAAVDVGHWWGLFKMWHFYTSFFCAENTFGDIELFFYIHFYITIFLLLLFFLTLHFPSCQNKCKELRGSAETRVLLCALELYGSTAVHHLLPQHSVPNCLLHGHISAHCPSSGGLNWW